MPIVNKYIDISHWLNWLPPYDPGPGVGCLSDIIELGLLCTGCGAPRYAERSDIFYIYFMHLEETGF